MTSVVWLSIEIHVTQKWSIISCSKRRRDVDIDDPPAPKHCRVDDSTTPKLGSAGDDDGLLSPRRSGRGRVPNRKFQDMEVGYTPLKKNGKLWNIFSSPEHKCSENYWRSLGIGVGVIGDVIVNRQKLKLESQLMNHERLVSHISHTYFLWQDLSMGTTTFDLVTLTLKFDLLITNFNLTFHISLVHNIISARIILGLRIEGSH